MSRPGQPTSRISTISAALAVLVGIPLGGLLIEAALARNTAILASEESIVADNSLDTTDDPEAPSPWWLVVMPAIPLMGGGLIYIQNDAFSGLAWKDRNAHPLYLRRNSTRLRHNPNLMRRSKANAVSIFSFETQ